MSSLLMALIGSNRLTKLIENYRDAPGLWARHRWSASLQARSNTPSRNQSLPANDPLAAGKTESDFSYRVKCVIPIPALAGLCYYGVTQLGSLSASA